MEEIDKLRIQIAKVEGFTIGIAETVHQLVQQIDTLERYVYESQDERHEEEHEETKT